MSTSVAIAIKAAIAILTNPKVRKALGWILVAILSPIILLIAFFGCLSSGAAGHNHQMVDYCFYDTAYSGEIPAEFNGFMTTMRADLATLDSAVNSVNASTEDGGLDPIQVKADFFVLCPGGELDTGTFLNCFYTTELRTRTVTVTNKAGEQVEQEQTYMASIPYPMGTVYANLAAALGREVTAEEKKSIQQIYTQIAGSGDEGYDGGYLRGSDPSVELDISAFTDPSTKNAHDLVAYAVHAWESGWGYVWGTYGNVLTEDLLAYKVQQYPDGVGQYGDFIRANWLGGRVTDCVGLIKGYGWLDPDDLKIKYGANGMPDIGANTMYRSATVKGGMDTMPDTPGLAVWMEGHIGVYIGGGEVIEASSTNTGVIKTQLAGRGWQAWLEVPYIHYD